MINRQAFFISLEGPDFSFKTSLRNELYDKMKKLYPNKNIYKISPIDYNSEESSLIRNYLNGVYGDPKDVEATISSMFYAVSRYDIVMKNKSMFEDENGIILCDRWTLSNLVYQASNRTEAKLVEFIETKLLNIPQPNLTILLEQDIDLAKQLMACTKSRNIDLLESKYLDSIYEKWYNNPMYRDIINDYCRTYSGFSADELMFYVYGKDEDDDSRTRIDVNAYQDILYFISYRYKTVFEDL